MSGIKGLTDKRRSSQLPIIGTIAKGEQDAGTRRLKVASTFLFTQPQVAHLKEVLGPTPDTLPIMFPRSMFWQVDDSDMDACIGLVLFTQLERRAGRRVICAGDGERITKHFRANDRTPPGNAGRGR